MGPRGHLPVGWGGGRCAARRAGSTQDGPGWLARPAPAVRGRGPMAELRLSLHFGSCALLRLCTADDTPPISTRLHGHDLATIALEGLLHINTRNHPLELIPSSVVQRCKINMLRKHGKIIFRHAPPCPADTLPRCAWWSARSVIFHPPAPSAGVSGCLEGKEANEVRKALVRIAARKQVGPLADMLAVA